VSTASDRLIENEFPEIDADTPQGAQQYLICFNRDIERLIEEYDLQTVGEAIWEIYGVGADLGRSATDPAAISGYADFYASLEHLYAAFARHCANRYGHSSQGCSFATACYMLWDMDSGLSYRTFNPEFVPPQLAERLLDFGLSHPHAAVQESFLHGLGHLHYRRPDYAVAKISGFLLRTDIQPGIRAYAERCLTGSIM
jgi:hypothetical protein